MILVLTALCVVGACGRSTVVRPPSVPSRTVPSLTVPSTRTSATAAVDTSTFRCLVQAYLDGVDGDRARRDCQWKALADRIAAAQLRQRVADELNHVFGTSITLAKATAWVTDACSRGTPVVATLVDSLRPDARQRSLLVTPLLDFAAAVDGQCGNRTDSRTLNAFAASAWSQIVPSPTAASVKKVLRDQHGAELSAMATELLKNAHSPCDVVGNAGLLLIGNLTGAHLPDWIQLVVGQVISVQCGKVFD